MPNPSMWPPKRMLCCALEFQKELQKLAWEDTTTLRERVTMFSHGVDNVSKSKVESLMGKRVESQIVDTSKSSAEAYNNYPFGTTTAAAVSSDIPGSRCVGGRTQHYHPSCLRQKILR